MTGQVDRTQSSSLERNVAESASAYVDSCVIVSVFAPSEEEIDKQRLRPSLWVLSAGQRGVLRLTMSPFVIPEVLGTGSIRGSHITPGDRLQRVESVHRYFQDNEIQYVELDQFLALEAAKLAVAHQLKGGDAVHLASALRAGCERLYTWDRDLLKLDGHESLGGMRCIEPQPEGQGDLLDELPEESPQEH